MCTPFTRHAQPHHDRRAARLHGALHYLCIEQRPRAEWLFAIDGRLHTEPGDECGRVLTVVGRRPNASDAAAAASFISTAATFAAAAATSTFTARGVRARVSDPSHVRAEPGAGAAALRV